MLQHQLHTRHAIKLIHGQSVGGADGVGGAFGEVELDGFKAGGAFFEC